MRIKNIDIESNTFFSFYFNENIVTDYVYFAIWFKKTEMVCIFKTHYMSIGSEEITIDRWMSESQFQNLADTKQITVESPTCLNFEIDLLQEVLKRYIERYPIIQC